MVAFLLLSFLHNIPVASYLVIVQLTSLLRGNARAPTEHGSGANDRKCQYRHCNQQSFHISLRRNSNAAPRAA